MGTCVSPGSQQLNHVQNFRLPCAPDSRPKSSENLSYNFKLIVSNIRGAHLLKVSLFINTTPEFDQRFAGHEQLRADVHHREES